MAEATNAEGKTPMNDMMCLLRERLDIEAFFHTGLWGARMTGQPLFLISAVQMRIFVSKCGGGKREKSSFQAHFMVLAFEVFFLLTVFEFFLATFFLLLEAVLFVP